MGHKIPQKFCYLFLVICLTSLACSLGGGSQSVSPTATPVNLSQPTGMPIPSDTATPTVAPTDTLAPSQTPTNTPLPSPTSAPATPAGDARQQLETAFGKLNSAYPFRITETGTLASGDGSQSTRTTDFAAADRSHSTLTTASGTDEMIRIGAQVYTRTDGGDWTTGAQGGFDVTQLTSLLLAALTDAQLAGPETLDGVDTLSYTFTGQFSDYAFTGKAWVGTADNLPYRVDVQVQLQGTPLDDSLVFKYGIQVNIVAPIP